MKKLLSLLCAFALILSISPSLAEHYGYAVIDARTSDRVHLRSGPSVGSDSMGLYFTGTGVECLSTPFDEWISVRIGQATGFMMARYLVHESAPSAVTPRQPGVTVNGSPVSLRDYPSRQAGSLRWLNAGTPLTLLGETSAGWSYVRTGDCLYGYVESSSITASSSSSKESLSFASLPSRWLLSSGAGAWGTDLTLFPDGRFEGSYHDSEMGESQPAYPNGTVYVSFFHGRLSQPVRISDTVWQTRVVEYGLADAAGLEWIEDGIRYVTSEGLGLMLDDLLTIYLPGTAPAQLPEDFPLWIHSYQGGLLETYALYNQHSDLGFEPQ